MDSNNVRLDEQIEVTRISNTVIRNHTTQVANGLSYTVGMHIGGCVQLLLLAFPRVRSEMTRALVFHDYPEFATGDIVGSAKTEYPELGEASTSVENKVEKKYKIMKGHMIYQEESVLLELIDRVELLYWCSEQYDIGCRAKRFMKMYQRVSEKCEALSTKLLDLFNRPDDFEFRIGGVWFNDAHYDEFLGFTDTCVSDFRGVWASHTLEAKSRG